MPTTFAAARMHAWAAGHACAAGKEKRGRPGWKAILLAATVFVFLSLYSTLFFSFPHLDFGGSGFQTSDFGMWKLIRGCLVS